MEESNEIDDQLLRILAKDAFYNSNGSYQVSKEISTLVRGLKYLLTQSELIVRDLHDAECDFELSNVKSHLRDILKEGI